MTAMKPVSGRLHLLAGALFGHALLEQCSKVDRVDHQRREAAVPRDVGDDLTCEGEQKAGALDEQNRQEMLLREVLSVSYTHLTLPTKA